MIDETMGNTPPDISQGTPVQEILERDNAQSSAPKVIKDQINQKRSYSTSARRLNLEPVPTTSSTMLPGVDYPDAGPGHKFPLPDVNSLHRLDGLKRRYDPLLEQFTKLIMKDGKLSKAQKQMSKILDILRTAPPPGTNAQFPNRVLMLSDSSASSTEVAITGQGVTTIPRSSLPLFPIEYLTTIIDSVAPLLKIRQQRGMAGGGQSLPIPVPLGVRQRRRQAIQWILKAAETRKEVNMHDRIGKELIRVAEGQSSAWEKRDLVHRLAVSARSNVRNMMGPRR